MKAPFISGVTAVLLAVAFLLFFGVIFLPPVHQTNTSSEVTQANSDVHLIALAVRAFEAEYGFLPGTNTSAVSGDLLAALMGNKETLNPGGVVFLEVRPKRKGRSGLQDGVFLDPWGGPYQIALANGSLNRVWGGTNRTEIPKRVAVWSDPELNRKGWLWRISNTPPPSVTSWE